tara:strand:+ start:511 stop:693 length:183 start_codon:yes stop_codon:yes gene_type:complete
MCGNKEGELQRTAEYICNIQENQGLFFAIAFLADSQYNNEELQRITQIMSERRLGFKSSN